MTSRLLDLTELPTEWAYPCADGTLIEMSYLLAAHGEAIATMQATGLIESKGSYGFALTIPIAHSSKGWGVSDWDDPEKYIAYVGGRGLERDRYAANAVRKLRPWLRQAAEGHEFDSTLNMRQFAPELFQHGVESQSADGVFPWGDYPWGGAAVVSFPGFALAGAVSGFSEVQDDTVARVILGSLAEQIIIGDGLLSDD